MVHVVLIAKRLVALGLIPLLLLLGQGQLWAQQAEQGWPQNDSHAPEQQRGYVQAQAPAQPLNAMQLEQLVAPIALYPDALVAQVLAASTYPAQVAEADHWRQAQGNAYPEQIAAGADVQPWDPSLKALAAFPQVLEQMDRNLQWTTDLGNAYYNQPQDVLEAVQVMRRRAEAAGNLRSTPQEEVRYEQGNIELAPVNPQVIYVPAYNPWAVYGEPVSPYPGFSLLGALGSFFGSSFGSSPISYGLGIAMTAFSHTPWGWLAWGLNWLAHAVLFQDSNYDSHSNTVADWGFRHRGFHAFPERGGMANSYDRGWRSFDRRGGGYVGHGQGFGRTSDRFGDNRFAENRSRERSSEGFRPFGGGYGRPQQAYNHNQMASRLQQQSRAAYGQRFSSGAGEGYGRRAERAYGNSPRSYRAQTSGFQRGEFGSSGKTAHSGGFHLFGGEHGPKSFGGGKNFGSGNSGRFHLTGGGGRAPKSFSSGKGFGGGKSFSRGHSGGGGHFGGHAGGHSGGHGGGRHHR
ncbi:MAG TPA: DUF3300 domain-containing protein [Candidatus Sulfotelmatobacter sp.]|nr:DUF3300 domain-containing protein [Candidatus Sulfotelmatobacter sp.]